MSDNHLNYMDKATNLQKTPPHPETDTLLACCQFPPQRDEELMLQAGCASLQITCWRTGIESCFLLNSRHTNITHRAENSPGSWTLLLLCEDPHAKRSIHLRTEIWTSKQQRPEHKIYWDYLLNIHIYPASLSGNNVIFFSIAKLPLGSFKKVKNFLVTVSLTNGMT